jgi:hypothetical protein
MGLRKLGLYRHGARIGCVLAEGSKNIFICLEGDGALRAETLPYVPPFAGRNWHEVQLKLQHTTSFGLDDLEKELQNVADYLYDTVEERYLKYGRFNQWVFYSDRYDDVIVNWKRADPFSCAMLVWEYHQIHPLTSLQDFDTMRFVVESLACLPPSPSLVADIGKRINEPSHLHKGVMKIEALCSLAQKAIKLLEKGENHVRSPDSQHSDSG